MHRVIERANRAHVAFDTFDAAGSRIESPLVERLCFGCAPQVGLQMLADQTGVDPHSRLSTLDY